MRVIFFGTPHFSVPSLQRLIDHPEIEVVAAVTQPDRRRGRGKSLVPSPVKELAVSANLPVLQPAKIRKDQDIIDKLQSFGADAFVVVAYGQILSEEILGIPTIGCINGHGSLLPAYRGASPMQRSLVDGQEKTGLVTMLMDKGMDTGAMLLRQETPIDLLDNVKTLGARLAEIAAEMLPETLLGLANGQVIPEPQDEEQATYAPLIDKAEYVLDWSKPAISLHNKVRGFYPGCHTQWRDSKLKILCTAPVGDEYWSQLPLEFSVLEHDWPAVKPRLKKVQGGPGTVVDVVKNIGPIVRTGDGYLLVRQVVPAGKRMQSGWDFANGSRLEVGEVLS
ncbi:MAG: methionyl-tRNA formyltransferase [Cyanobacteria bacterium P01_F01_bin.153]